jgi:DNA repair exonuclease SbcCD ATPase subunit
LKNIDFSKFGYYAKNKTAEEIVLDLLNENKTLKERKRKAENDLNLLQLKYNEDLRKIVEYDHIIEKLNDEKAKLRDQTNKLKTDRTNFEKEKEILGHNMNNINTNNAPNTIKSPRSGSVDRTVKSKEDGQKKMPKKQLLKDLETVTKQLEQLTQEYEAAKSQWQQEKKKFEEERNKTQPKERTEVPDNGSGSNLSSPDQPTNMNPEVFYKNKWLKLKERHEQDLRRTKSLEEERNKLKSDLAKLPRAGSTPSIELAPSLANAKLFRHPQLEQTPNLSQLLKEKLALNNELRQLRLQLNDINGKISHGTLEASDPQKIEIDASIQTKTARLEEVSKLIDEEDSKSNLNSANLAHKPKNSPKLNVPTEVRISIKTLTLVLVVIVAYVFKTL